MDKFSLKRWRYIHGQIFTQTPPLRGGEWVFEWSELPAKWAGRVATNLYERALWLVGANNKRQWTIEITFLRNESETLITIVLWSQS
jgi:hypothetical protein